MYYLQQAGIYFRGVFWIGENLEQGIIEADKHAEADVDDYHQWQVCEYMYGCEKHDIVYETEKGKKANKAGR